jgi:hypothetical protein
MSDKSIGEPIDRKFLIDARCMEHGHTHTEHDSVLFLAKDKALPATLEFYKQECIRLGAEPPQMLGVELLIERVKKWQETFSNNVRVADIDLPVGESILRPNNE